MTSRVKLRLVNVRLNITPKHVALLFVSWKVTGWNLGTKIAYSGLCCWKVCNSRQANSGFVRQNRPRLGAYPFKFSSL